jgi:transposase
MMSLSDVARITHLGWDTVKSIVKDDRLNYLKEELRELWQQPDHASATSALQAWICKAMSTDLGPMKRLAKTLLTHAKGVLGYFIHPISSGMIEGIKQDRTPHQPGLWLPRHTLPPPAHSIAP